MIVTPFTLLPCLFLCTTDLSNSTPPPFPILLLLFSFFFYFLFLFVLAVYFPSIKDSWHPPVDQFTLCISPIYPVHPFANPLYPRIHPIHIFTNLFFARWKFISSTFFSKLLFNYTDLSDPCPFPFHHFILEQPGKEVCVWGGGEVVRVVLLAWLASDVAIVDAHSDGLKCHR